MPDRPHRLDATGTVCPLPILLSVREMRKLQPGDLLEVLGDDPTILEDMPIWCERAGHRLVEIGEDAEGRIRSLVEKGPNRPPAPRPPALDGPPAGLLKLTLPPGPPAPLCPGSSVGRARD